MNVAGFNEEENAMTYIIISKLRHVMMNTGRFSTTGRIGNYARAVGESDPDLEVDGEAERDWERAERDGEEE